jgi:poly(A) polymerase
LQTLKNILFQKIISEGKKEDLILELLKSIIKGTKFDHKVYIAGGFVRDEIIGEPSKDIDIVVELPGGGIELAEFIAKKLGIYKPGTNPVVYERFGTAMLYLDNVIYKNVKLDGIEVEFVASRKEQYHQDSRKPEVSYGSLKDDVYRRDLTVNSLLKSLTTGEILDLTGYGKADIAKGIVRTPLDPDITFKDDPLRMLRVIRFTVKYGWHLPKWMIDGIKRNAYRLNIISKERIKDELSKILVSPNPVTGIRLLQLTGLTKYIIPELDDLVGMKQNKYHKDDAFKHTMEVLKNVPPNLVSRLAALMHDIGKVKTKEVINNEVHFYKHEDVGAEMAREIMQQLKFPNDIIDAVCLQIKNHMRLKNSGKEGTDISDKALRKLRNDIGPHLEGLFDLIHADNISHTDDASMPLQIPRIRKRMKDLQDIPVQQHVKLPLSGEEIMQLTGLKPSKQLGDLKRALEDKYFENPKMSKEEAKEFVLKVFRKM